MRVTGHAVPASGEVGEEGDDIPTSMAQDSGLDAVDVD